MSKLELKHIVGYLPYGLEILRPDGRISLKLRGVCDSSYIFIENNEDHFGDLESNHNKPILRPLSDLVGNKTADEIGRHPLIYITSIYVEKIIKSKWEYSKYDFNWEGDNSAMNTGRSIATYNGEIIFDISKGDDVTYLPYCIIEQLLEWQFDVHGLIEKGLAIDVNTLENNPYE